MSAADVISDLIRAANQIEDLTCFERHELLARAAGLISDYGELLNFTPTNSVGSGDIACNLYAMAYSVELLAPAAVADAMLEAVEVIRALRIQLSQA